MSAVEDLLEEDLEIILHDFKNFDEFLEDSFELKEEGQNTTQTENEIFHFLDVCPDTDGAPVVEFLHRLPYQIQVTEGYLKLILASFGVILNILFLSVLLWPPKSLKAHFHGMVVQLLGVETIVITKDIIDSLRIVLQDSQCSISYWSVFLTVHLLYPLKHILSFCSVFLVCTIAIEQTKALRNPMSYKEKMFQRSFKNTFKLTIWGFLAAFIIGIPLAFELNVVKRVIHIRREGNVMKETLFCPQLASYRYSKSYIIGYRALVVFLPTLIVPFFILSTNAYRMLWILSRRSKLVNRPKNKNPHCLALKSEAQKNCKSFGLLMVLLIVSYLPAVILGISEAILSNQFLYGQTHKCSAIPMWHHQLSTINQLFQAIFASFSGSLFAWSCGSFRKKFWYFLGRSMNRAPQNTVVSGLRENVEVEEDFTASGMAMAMAELDLERSEKVDQEGKLLSSQSQNTVKGCCVVPDAVIV